MKFSQAFALVSFATARAVLPSNELSLLLRDVKQFDDDLLSKHFGEHVHKLFEGARGKKRATKGFTRGPNYGDTSYFCDADELDEATSYEEVVSTCQKLNGELLYGYVRYGYSFPYCDNSSVNTIFFDEGNALYEQFTRESFSRVGLVYFGDMETSCTPFVTGRYLANRVEGFSRFNDQGNVFTGKEGEILGEIDYDNMDAMADYCLDPAENSLATMQTAFNQEQKAWVVDLTRYMGDKPEEPLYPNVAFDCTIDGFSFMYGVFYQTITDMGSLSPVEPSATEPEVTEPSVTEPEVTEQSTTSTTTNTTTTTSTEVVPIICYDLLPGGDQVPDVTCIDLIVKI